jgi:uncharacterized C2H2 Zn-finger protein
MQRQEFTCNTCGQRFNSRDDLDSHTRTAHAGAQNNQGKGNEKRM